MDNDEYEDFEKLYNQLHSIADLIGDESFYWAQFRIGLLCGEIQAKMNELEEEAEKNQMQHGNHNE